MTTPALYRRKVAAIRDELPSLEHVLLVGPGAAGIDGTLAFDDVMAAASDRFEIPPTRPEDMALLHFTSGTTGAPKGAVHVHEAVVAHHATGTSALDLHDDDVFWCTADPGWVTGTSYGDHRPAHPRRHEHRRRGRLRRRPLVPHPAGPRGDGLVHGADRAADARCGPGSDLAREYDLSKLRFVASVGEPLNPEAVVWGQEALGLPVHDNWWQTETGGIMIANLAGAEVHPGSMGRPLPGVEAAVLARGPDGRAAVADDGSVEVVDDPASRASSPCVPAGRRCSAATSTTTSATRGASPAAGTSPATSCAATRTGGCGSWAAPTT